jgi:hypothetical protein
MRLVGGDIIFGSDWRFARMALKVTHLLRAALIIQGKGS